MKAIKRKIYIFGLKKRLKRLMIHLMEQINIYCKECDIHLTNGQKAKMVCDSIQKQLNEIDKKGDWYVSFECKKKSVWDKLRR